MKSKATTYLLVASVFVIWGMIIWKLFAPSRVDIYPVQNSVFRATISERSDTLRLDYPDPFLKKQETVKIPEYTISSSKIVELDIQPLEKVREECRIRYIGHIREGKNLNYLVESNGKYHSVISGDIVDGFRLTRIYQDSLIFTKEEFYYTIKLSR